MKGKKKLESLLTDPEMTKRLTSHLRSKKRILSKGSPFSEILQSMVNTMLEGEMDAFMDEEKASEKVNKRNGGKTKKVTSELGTIDVYTPRDRKGDFEPVIVAKRERELSSGLDDQILALYAQGNSIEDVRRLLMEIYGVSISAGRISQITDKILPEIEEWRTRSLSSFYPVIYLDAIHFKVRQDGRYKNSAFYTVYSVDWEGNRDLLALHMNGGGEGSNQWGVVLEDLKRRGVKDVLVMCTDNLNGFTEAIGHTYPYTVVQKCIVHQVRNSLRYVDDKESKAVAKGLRKIYTSLTEEQAKTNLQIFEKDWGVKYGYITKQWKDNWGELMAFLDFPIGMRKMIYTTNPVEALHRIMRKLIKSKAAWVSEVALIKQLYLSLMYNQKSWKRKAYGWKEIQRTIMEMYPDRVPK